MDGIAGVHGVIKDSSESARSTGQETPIASSSRSSLKPPSDSLGDRQLKRQRYFIIAAIVFLLGCYSILNVGVATGMRNQLIASVEPDEVSQAREIGGSLVVVVVLALTLLEWFMLLLGRSITRMLLGVGDSAIYDRIWFASQIIVMPIAILLGLRAMGEQAPPSIPTGDVLVFATLVLLSGIVLFWCAVRILKVSRLRAGLTFVAQQGITLVFILGSLV